MDAQELRTSFLRFFEERAHTVVPSASLIPVDPTLLLTNAGMVPFKSYFVGEEPPPFERAVSAQKCARTVDIEVVGTTARHLSFFEMLGNFSFGDYFKEKAIPWAYEYVTEHLGLDPELLWFTVHESDDEAAAIWIETVGVPSERVQRRGRDNFWQMGIPGPCGPSSEIFYDRGASYGPEGGPVVDEERYVEIWNLVFMQNIQDEPYHVIGDLPARNIDTGMGLERVVMVLQEKESSFEIDVVRPVLEAGAAHAGVRYGDDAETDVSLRILADHGRLLTFLIGDGVVPSNEGRGYVLRRVIRRAVRHAWELGGEGFVTPRLVAATVEAMADGYPEIRRDQDLITEIASREEDRFRRTLESGHELLTQELAALESDKVLPGTTAFRLHDTYGFPVELTRELAEQRGYQVDLEVFEHEMETQRARARAAWRGGEAAVSETLYHQLLEDLPRTEFVGYGSEAARGRVMRMIADGGSVDRAEEGDDLMVFLDRTPFYAEQGGQAGDSGVMVSETGRLEVRDTTYALPGIHAHHATVSGGFILAGQEVEATIDSDRREGIRKSHTGTHILHWALREVVGEHVKQAGSLVEDGRLRFDFSHYGPLTEEQLAQVERVANRRVIENAPVRAFHTTRREADEMGALAFFGEKYGETVRVVEAGEYSRELCGGTHCHTTGQVGPIVILGESSVGANLRRLEALTGTVAYDYVRETRGRLEQTARLLRTQPAQVPERLESMLRRLRDLEEELGAAQDRARSEVADSLAGTAEPLDRGRLVIGEHHDADGEALRALALQVRDRLESGVVVLGSKRDGKGMLVAVATPDLVREGVSAGEILAPAARALGGGGSRDPELAQAGGPDGDRLADALAEAERVARASLAGE